MSTNKKEKEKIQERLAAFPEPRFLHSPQSKVEILLVTSLLGGPFVLLLAYMGRAGRTLQVSKGNEVTQLILTPAFAVGILVLATTLIMLGVIAFLIAHVQYQAWQQKANEHFSFINPPIVSLINSRSDLKPNGRKSCYNLPTLSRIKSSSAAECICIKNRCSRYSSSF